MTLDANILIAYLAGEQVVVDSLTRWKEEGKLLLLSSVAESEVLSFGGWTDEERQKTEAWLGENFTSITFDRAIARVAANLRRASRIKFPDAAIAATALSTQTPLVKRNTEDFKKVPGLTLVSL